MFGELGEQGPLCCILRCSAQPAARSGIAPKALKVLQHILHERVSRECRFALPLEQRKECSLVNTAQHERPCEASNDRSVIQAGYGLIRLPMNLC
jgi:hypothetical protein